MINYYIKAADEAAMWEALVASGIAVISYDLTDPLNQKPEDAPEDWAPTGAVSYSCPGYDLDVIGIIYKDSGQVDEEGNPIMVPEEGYHANLRNQEGYPLTEEQQAALPLIPTPANPVRIWAGD